MTVEAISATSDAGPPHERLAVPLRRLARWRLLRLTPLLLVVGLLLVWPLIMLAAGSFRTAPPGFVADWSTAAWRQAFDNPATLQAIRNSVIIALVSTTVATAFAAGLAFLSERSDAPLRRWITPAMVLAFATPGLFYAIGFGLVANPYTGFLNTLVQVITGTNWTPLDIETWPGLLAVVTLKKTAVIYLFLIGPFRALDPSHDEASLMAGAGPLATFLRIDIPILAPALTGAVLLGVVSGLQTFDMALVLGWPFDLQVIATRIFQFVNEGATPQYDKASVLSLALLAVVAGLSLAQARILGRRSFVTVGGKSRAGARMALGRGRLVAAVLIALYLLVGVALPVGSVLLSSFQPFPGVYSGFSFQSYVDVALIPRLWDSLKLTLLLAFGTGLAAMALAFLVVQGGRWAGPRAAAWLKFATFIPLAMPGVVTALAIGWAFLSLPGLKHLYGTAELVAVALVVCAMPFAVQAIQAGASQIAPELHEAAAVAGAPPHRVLFDVAFRLLIPSFLIGWFMTAVLATGNLEVPLLLKSPGEQPVSAVIYDLNARGEFSAACALLTVTLIVKALIALAGYAGFRAFRNLRPQPGAAR